MFEVLFWSLVGVIVAPIVIVAAVMACLWLIDTMCGDDDNGCP